MSDSHDLNEEEQELLDAYNSELLDYVREETSDNDQINNLLDQDILYLYELWDEYLDEVLAEDENVEIDIEDLYKFVCETAEEDEEYIEITKDDLVLLCQLQQEFEESLYDEDEDEE